MSRIELDEAKKLAESAARRNLDGFLTKPSDKVLDEVYLEAEYCWMFFRCREIFVPPEFSLRGDWAYAVSKNGEVRDIPDFSDDREQLNAYLAKMSEFFSRR